jgi:murein DD-endopeptidase MepM/ murein hydrolase activator NlpD
MNAVSRLFGVSQSEIARMNNLRAPYKLRAGQVLRMPSITEKTEPEVFAQANAMPTTSLAAVMPAPVEIEQLDAPPITGLSAPVTSSVSTATTSAPAHTLQLPQGYGQEPVQTAMASPVIDAPPMPDAVQSNMIQPAAVQPAPASPQAKLPKSPVTAKIPPRASKKFLKPVSGKMLSSYGPKDNGSFNDGINIGAARGAAVVAAENGVVVYADNELKGSGNLVLIRHADRWVTAYAHLDEIKVRRGDVVNRGQPIGTVGSSGAVDKPQLHFEVRRGIEAINPEVYLES